MAMLEATLKAATPMAVEMADGDGRATALTMTEAALETTTAVAMAIAYGTV